MRNLLIGLICFVVCVNTLYFMSYIFPNNIMYRGLGQITMGLGILVSISQMIIPDDFNKEEQPCSGDKKNG